jgi:cytochrome P450
MDCEIPRAARFPQLAQRRWLYEGSEGPLWTRLPRVGAARAFELPEGLVLLQHEDIRAVLRDPAFVAWNVWALGRDPGVDPRFMEWRRRQLLSMEGPSHARLRRLAGPALSARAMEAQRPRMRALAERLLEQVAAGPFEANATLCRPYPVGIMCSLMDLPEADAALIGELSERWLSWLAGGAAAVPRALSARETLEAYLAPRVEARRTGGGADLISLFARAFSGEDCMSSDELLDTAAGMLAAGIESTWRALATGLYLFARHPEQWDKLAQAPALAASAVSEILRVLPPFPVISRIAPEDAEVNGLMIPAQTRIYLLVICASHDPSLHAEPERFDIARASTPTLAFGAARHACAGVHLARVQLEEALKVLSATVERVELDGEPQWGPAWESLHGPVRLPLRFRLR